MVAAGQPGVGGNPARLSNSLPIAITMPGQAVPVLSYGSAAAGLLRTAEPCQVTITQGRPEGASCPRAGATMTDPGPPAASQIRHRRGGRYCAERQAPAWPASRPAP